MENAKVSNKKLMSLAILFVSALEMGGMGLQPALADIAAAFPDIPTVWMQEMSNWPGFAMLLGCALSTLLATKVSKKALCQDRCRLCCCLCHPRLYAALQLYSAHDVADHPRPWLRLPYAHIQWHHR